MEWVLGIGTLLGGVAAIGYLIEKVRKRRREELVTGVERDAKSRRLDVELAAATAGDRFWLDVTNRGERSKFEVRVVRVIGANEPSLPWTLRWANWTEAGLV